MTVLQDTGNIPTKNTTETERASSSSAISKAGISKRKPGSFQCIDYRHGHLTMQEESDGVSVAGDQTVAKDKKSWEIWSLYGHSVMKTMEKFDEATAVAPLNKNQFVKEVSAVAKSVCPNFEDVFTTGNIKILIVYDKEVTIDSEGKWVVEAKEAIFTPEQRHDAWENQNYFGIRLNAELTDLFLMRVHLYDVLIIAGGSKSIRDLNRWTETNLDLMGSDLPVKILHLCYKSKRNKTEVAGRGQSLTYTYDGDQFRALQSGKTESIKTAPAPRKVRQTQTELRKSKPASTTVVKGRSAKKLGNLCAGWIVAVLAVIVAVLMFHVVCPVWHPLAYILKFFGVDMCEYQKN